MRWYVLHTKPRNEIKVSQKLQQQGIETFAPTYQVVRQWSDRKKKIRVPYFASYVFVRLSEKDRDLVFCHSGVLRYLYWQGAPAVVRDTEIEMIRTYLHGQEREDVLVEALKPGDQVVLLRGALKDQQAFVEHLSSTRVRLILPVLGYKITTRISDVVPVRTAS
ncbi:UpxY family transcription antiterminator [Robiginitalea aurantiaca]|uniref:UpxY family transcription antiterminator n=1 Tax=Robiginitalea aurantiaca TaxID=3056915 RepID=A0ABT7WE12_9FLAO|nr:UpxY family transcription antiterminator [Robiginitalea aurantiaca]MDM9631157.1 UpxY family transcription antiterminator [Robiginitalea aurantiaca]